VLKALEKQKKAIQAMAGNANGMKDASAIKDLAEDQLMVVESGVEAARAEIAHANQMAQKADATKGRADHQKAESHAIRESAKKHMETASGVKDSIDSEAQVSQAGVEEIRTMIDRAEMEATGSKAIRKAEEDIMAAVQEAQRLQAAKAISGASDMVAAVPRTTELGAHAMGGASQKVVAAAQALREEMAKVAVPDARRSELEAKQSKKAAIAREDQMLEQAADRRLCVHLPGVQLKVAGEESGFPRMVGRDPTGTHEECAEKCQKQAGCKQALFSWEGGCHLMTGNTDQVQEFLPEYNSSYCGALSEKDTLLDMIHKAYAQKPYIPPPVTCSWADEDCGHTQCCNNFHCKWDFSECGGYSCFKKDANYAGCHYVGPPADWDATKLGGPRPLREIPKAQTPWLLQGTSLFCFSAVMWNKPATKKFYDSEAEVANNWKTKGLGILQCDENLILAGEEAPPSSWGSVSNIDAFIHMWEKVRQDGRYKNHDWVVKVDVDAVFFPDRLRMHLDQLRTPRSAKVYLKNVDYRFQFMGALEVMTKQALDVYFENADLCSRKQGHEGGEDFYLKTCLDGIGIDHQTDFKLLHDKYAAQDGCNDGWAAAFHFYKAVKDWDECHAAAIAAR
jgi:hypothetical protein